MGLVYLPSKERICGIGELSGWRLALHFLSIVTVTGWAFGGLLSKY